MLFLFASREKNGPQTAGFEIFIRITFLKLVWLEIELNGKSWVILTSVTIFIPIPYDKTSKLRKK